MKALVTGSTGGLGSNICKHLLQHGIEVRALMRTTSPTEAIADLDVERVIGDVTDYDSLVAVMHGCDWVFHTAALVTYWTKKWDAAHAVNVGGTRNVVRAALETGVKRLVHTSSIATVGVTYDPNKIPDETWPFDTYKWQIPYHATKRQGEEAIYQGVKQGLQAVICNPCLIFGERDINMNAAKVFKLVRSLSPFFPGAGGSAICDADDVAEGHIAAAEKGRVGERYLMTSVNLTAREYFTLAAEVCGAKPPRIPLVYPSLSILARITGKITEMTSKKEPTFDPKMPFMVRGYVYGSAEKARRELGYTSVPPRDSMEKEYRWLVDHGKIER